MTPEELSDQELVAFIEAAKGSRKKLDRHGAFASFKPRPFQRPWFESDKQFRAIFAANQVGKTTCGSITITSAGMGCKPPSLGGTLPDSWEQNDCHGKLYLLVSKSFQSSVTKTILPKLREFLTPEMISWTKNHPSTKLPNIFHLVTGAEIHLQSYEQDSESFEGPTWDGAWFDEPPPQPVFNAVWRGVMARQGWVLITATPLSEPWMHEVIVEQAETEGTPMSRMADIFHAEMEDNCAEHNGGTLPHLQIENFLASLPPKEREARQYGLFLDLQGREFPYFTRQTHVVPDLW